MKIPKISENHHLVGRCRCKSLSFHPSSNWGDFCLLGTGVKISHFTTRKSAGPSPVINKQGWFLTPLLILQGPKKTGFLIKFWPFIGGLTPFTTTRAPLLQKFADQDDGYLGFWQGPFPGRLLVTTRIIIYSINDLDLAGNYYLVGDYHIYTIIMILHFATITDNLDTRKQKKWLATFV